MWQDIVMAIATGLFSYALIPQVYHGFKNKKGYLTLQTSLITTLGIYAIAISFLTLKLYFSPIMNFVSGTLGLLLFIQGVMYQEAR